MAKKRVTGRESEWPSIPWGAATKPVWQSPPPRDVFSATALTIRESSNPADEFAALPARLRESIKAVLPPLSELE